VHEVRTAAHEDEASHAGSKPPRDGGNSERACAITHDEQGIQRQITPLFGEKSEQGLDTVSGIRHPLVDEVRCRLRRGDHVRDGLNPEVFADPAEEGRR
jgi:hypothetical protein